MANPGDKKRQRDAEDASAGSEEASGQISKPPSKKARVDSQRSLFIRSLPPSATSESLTEFFSQHYPVKHATVVLDPKTKTSRGYGFVSFTDPEDATEAREKLNNQPFEGRKLKLDIAQPRARDVAKSGSEVGLKAVAEKRKREAEMEEARKAPKLIIRNLPWSIKTSDQLAKLFQGFGKVKYSDLPNAKGKLSGFGFVTLRGRKNAEKAMREINGKEVDGRTLAVDWAVDKATWDKQHDTAKPEKEDAEKTEKSAKAKKSKKPAKEEAEAEDPNMTQEDRDLANFFKNYGDNLEDEEESDDDAKDKEDEDDNEEKDEDADEDEDEELGDENLSEGSVASDEEEKPQQKRTTDNATTLFIRNLPYTATDETLKTHFARFGAVRYARVVMDRSIDKPAGTGFVCFFNADDCKACLRGAPLHRPAPTLGKHSVLQDEAADPDGKYTFEGRILQVAQAVNKDEAARLTETGPGAKRKEKDRRRLYLLSEGNIPANSPLFNTLAPNEVKQREASAKQRKKMIEGNPSLHISLTRLAIRNLPSTIGSKELKALARQAVVGFAKDVKEGRREPISKEENSRGGEADKEAETRRKKKGKGVVTQAKIVFESREGSKVDERVGAGKSRGYGFIEYSSHRWALMGLRYLNGHAVKNEAGKTQRLIVEFAIENANVVMRRQQQVDKFKQVRDAGPGPNPAPTPRTREKGGDGKSKWPKKFGKDDRGRGDKGRGDKGGKGGKGGKPEESKAGDKAKVPPTKEAHKQVDEKLAMRTKIIVRKRTMRKKKANARAGN
ncbi:hypothetical protein BT67DRAFT_437580 [Trichocladium antarcticum]|uniref:RRM domain-containing protein n=1 Tax=Trichocladium antarcticum TaxID=1450529 RepID=A0AAN6UT91_9PEZI|nr:hypothetical protein BT67DRAFT_437580 [Trichocladium antarcticum]